MHKYCSESRPKWLWLTKSLLVVFGFGKLLDGLRPLILLGRVMLMVSPSRVWEAALQAEPGATGFYAAMSIISLMVMVVLGTYALCNFWRLPKGLTIVKLGFIAFGLQLLCDGYAGIVLGRTVLIRDIAFAMLRYVILIALGYIHWRFAHKSDVSKQE